jgi:hypothetical protein
MWSYERRQEPRIRREPVGETRIRSRLQLSKQRSNLIRCRTYDPNAPAAPIYVNGLRPRKVRESPCALPCRQSSRTWFSPGGFPGRRLQASPCKGTLTDARKGSLSLCVGSDSSANHEHGRGRLPSRPISMPCPAPPGVPGFSHRNAVFPRRGLPEARGPRLPASWRPA